MTQGKDDAAEFHCQSAADIDFGASNSAAGRLAKIVAKLLI
jgi:hypothetical protein